MLLSGSCTLFFNAFAPAFILSPMVSVPFSVSTSVLCSASPARDAIYPALDSPPGSASPLSFMSTFVDSVVGFFVSVVGEIFLVLSGSWLSFSDLEIMYSALDSPPDSASPFSFLSSLDVSCSITNIAIAVDVYKDESGGLQKKLQNLDTMNQY